jgi:hypothetical protein
VLNASADTKMLSWIPKGTLRIIVQASNKNDDNLLRFAVVVLFDK